MRCTNKMKSRPRLSAKAAVGVAILAMLALGTYAAPANARWDEQNNARWDERNDHRDSHRDNRDNDRHDWNGGYYAAPPVVYGPYGGYGYYPPPVIYGPGIGISVPGVFIDIR